MNHWKLPAGISLMIALFAISSCDNLSPETRNNVEDLNEEELEVAAQIIGSSLSDEGEGVLSSLYDAVSQVEQEKISYEQSGSLTSHIHKYGDRRWEAPHRHDSTGIRAGHNRGRGGETDYESSYNPETGEHTIQFDRSYTGTDFSKSLKVHSVYIYSDVDGGFLQYPRRQKDEIESINFKGTREGSTESAMRSNNFFRADTLFLDGISSVTPILTLEGTHYGNGEINAVIELRDIIKNRTYEVFFEMEDIRIDKAIVQENGNLEEGITGFINYQMYMSKTVNGDTREQDLSGVIELTGDGHALLRFNKLQKFFRIALGTGIPGPSQNR